MCLGTCWAQHARRPRGRAAGRASDQQPEGRPAAHSQAQMTPAPFLRIPFFLIRREMYYYDCLVIMYITLCDGLRLLNRRTRAAPYQTVVAHPSYRTVFDVVSL
eukprot:COSAG01_NODE_5152_length_4451_cov_13.224724_1_plen_104_part_00